MTKEVVRGFSYDQTTSFRDRREHTRCDEMIKRVLKLAPGNVCKHFSNVGEQGANSIGCSSPRLNRRDNKRAIATYLSDLLKQHLRSFHRRR